MVEPIVQTDVFGGLESAINAFEQGLDEYQVQFHTWSEDRRKLVGRETAAAEQQASERTRKLDELAEQLARERKTLEQSKAELERHRADVIARASES